MIDENSRLQVQPQQGEENKWWPIFAFYSMETGPVQQDITEYVCVFLYFDPCKNQL